MTGNLKELAKKLAKGILKDYSIYRIYSCSEAALCNPDSAALEIREIDEALLESDPAPLIREQSGYAGPGSHAYACIEGDRIVGVCFYWFGERYVKERNFWPLAKGEAKLVQIVVTPEMRGRGIATRLVASSFRDMKKKNFHRAFARIWHSNTPSLKAFRRAGWEPVALVIEFAIPGIKRPFRFRL